MQRKGKPIVTHNAPDLDSVAAIYLLHKHGREWKNLAIEFDREGDKAIEWAVRDIFTSVDRGKGVFDHHVRENQKRAEKGEKPETSTSLVAKKLKLDENAAIQKLIRKVERSDLQGESLPFDASDLIKCMQRLEVTNEKIIELGLRIIDDCIKFAQQKLTRDNQNCQRLIKEFLTNKETIPPKFKEYLERLDNPKFERPLDFVEIWTVEGESNKEFLFELLEYEYEDSINYLKALKEVKNSWKVVVKGCVIVADLSENPRFKDAARNQEKALITIQRRSSGHTQIYFDTERSDDVLIESLLSMIRLEECLIQNREIPKEDLRKSEYVLEIPEWYYFKAPLLPGKKKKPGRFILNGSLTAPDIPPSKIPMDTLREIAIKAVVFYPRFNWARWVAERKAHYIKKPNSPLFLFQLNFGAS